MTVDDWSTKLASAGNTVCRPVIMAITYAYIYKGYCDSIAQTTHVYKYECSSVVGERVRALAVVFKIK